MNRRTAMLAPLVVVASLSVLHATQQTTFRSRTDLVRIDVLASNGRQPITDLTPADFDVRDQGTQQKIEFMRFEELPLNIVVVCDLSLSVAGDDAANIVRAVRSLLPTLRKGDRVSLITFGDVVVERLPLTEDVGSLVTALEAAKPGGLTPLIDAVYTGITLIGPEPGRSLALVFSDGLDTSSFLRQAQLLDAVKASPATVYAASVGSASTALLKEVTDTSGGRHTEIASTRNLEAVFSEFLGEFRKRYVIGYEPTSTAPGWHRLEIKVRRAGVDVRARPGYVVAR